MTPIVAFAIPSGDMVRAETLVHSMVLAAFTAASGIQAFVVNQKASDICQARNEIVKAVLETTATHICWIDSDNTMPSDGLVRLLKAKKDIVGSLYSSREPPYVIVGKLKHQEDLSSGGLSLAEFIPGGFCLVRRSVYEAMKGPWYREGYYEEHVSENNPFGFVSDDVHFCWEAKKHGFEVWADLKLSEEVGHMGSRVHFISPTVFRTKG